MDINYKDIIAFCSLCIALVVLILNFVDRKRANIKNMREEWKNSFNELNERLEKYIEKLDGAHSSLKVVEAQVAVFWRGVAYNGAMVLHSPHTPDFDALIDKFVRGEMDNSEFTQFKDFLFEIARSFNENKFRRFIAQEVLLAIYVQDRGDVLVSIEHEDLQVLFELVNLWRLGGHRMGAGA